MQNHGKIQRIIVSIILSIIALVLVFSLSNFTHAQYLHNQTLYEITKVYTHSKKVATLAVGKDPVAIGVYTDTYVDRHRIYVANRYYGTVSVIDGTNNTKIGKDIQVREGPSAIAVDDRYRNRIYVANKFNDTVSVIDGTNNKIVKDIPVGHWPSAIAVDKSLHRIYVANSRNNTVSVIDGNNNTKIGKDIPVGNEPSAIAVDDNTNTIYVANYFNSSLSVINGTINKVVKDIPVGGQPSAIALAPFATTIYVANYAGSVSVIPSNTKIAQDIPEYRIANPVSIAVDPICKNRAIGDCTNWIYVANLQNTVSVINGTNNKIVKNIPVGNLPSAIAVDESTNTIYVANMADNTVSIIDGEANQVVAKVMFKIEPFNAGYIECDKIKTPIAEQFYIYSGSECTGKPYQGFEFVSWQENLGKNSTQLISLLPPPTIVDSILDFLDMNPDKPEAKLNITKFGNFTATFRALPPPLPPEYVATLIGVVATAFIGTWLTPALIGRRKTRTQRTYFKECISQIGKLDKNAIEDKIIGYYADGNLSDVQHQLLNNKISEYYAKEKSQG